MKNESAFPNDGQWANGAPERGMTLRDHFAAKAMQTLIHDWCEGDSKHADDVAKHAGIFADAMMRERDLRPTDSQSAGVPNASEEER